MRVSMIAIAVLALAPAMAQDPAKVASNNYKCTFENERVRVCEISIKAGELVPTHSHPDHVIYALSPGKMKITHADGKSTEVDIAKGQVLWTPAETHTGMNTGTTEIKAVIVELKK